MNASAVSKHRQMVFLRGYLTISTVTSLLSFAVIVLLANDRLFISALVLGAAIGQAAMLAVLYRWPQIYTIVVVILLLFLVGTLFTIDLLLPSGQLSLGVGFYFLSLISVFMLGPRTAWPVWGMVTVVFSLARWLDPHEPIDTVLTVVMGAALVALAQTAERARGRSIRYAEQREIELEGALARAEAASRLKSTFLATMSHEIRTPMNGVLGTGRALLDTSLDDEQQELTETLMSSGEGLLTILNSILDFSRLEAGEVPVESVPLPLAMLLSDVVRLFMEPAREGQVELVSDLQINGVGWVSGDPTRIRQMLNNLVGNAIKFTPRGGRVTVSLSLDDASRYRFVVSDTGPGIPADKQATLFEPFVQADASTTRQHGGTGLGLAICRRLAERMGGEIGVDSVPGAGCSFWFVLPLPEADPITLHDAGTPQLQPLPIGARILVVEDNAVNQLVIRRLLAKLGDLEVTLVPNGAEAVEQVSSAPWDLVLMDCYMPVMDGFAATRAIRALPSAAASIPIIALTASATSDDRRDIRAAGMDAIVAKPIDPDTLQAEMWSWLQLPAHSSRR